MIKLISPILLLILLTRSVVCQIPTTVIPFVTACPNVPCLNGGTCNVATNQCTCSPNYTGIFCERDVNACDSQPCQNNGMCVINSANQFMCICLTGFIGQFCETLTDPCTSVNCQNNGVCLDSGICDCPVLYNGTYCETYIGCLAGDKYSCLNDGVCNNFGVCSCTSKYTGAFCETFIGGCLATFCQNGGDCLSTGICDCPDGFEGTYCDIQTPSDTNSTNINTGLTVALCIGIIIPVIIAIIFAIIIIYYFYGKDIKKCCNEKLLKKRAERERNIYGQSSTDTLYFEDNNGKRQNISSITERYSEPITHQSIELGSYYNRN